MRGIDKLEEQLELENSIRWNILKIRANNLYGIEKEKLLQDIYYMRYEAGVYIGFESEWDQSEFLTDIINDFASNHTELASKHSSFKRYIIEIFNFFYKSKNFISQDDKIFIFNAYNNCFENLMAYAIEHKIF